ncbi:ferredoxin reductase [Streptomyces sp. NPDC005301]|uniref:ferredoxin reductase n=1 Tax=Streptomyces sp. NPDC005301 TaxID=3156874 RepID=UPI0033AEA6E5
MTGTWRPARLVARHAQTATARTLVLDTPNWPGHLPGQHIDVRLTGEDGYQAVRSYSLAGPPTDDRLELGIQPVPRGEVSPYLADDLPLGAQVEITGPLGGWFVWRPGDAAAVLLVAGGSGIVPLMAMVRAHQAAKSTTPFRLVYSVRSPDQAWYQKELASGSGPLTVDVLYSRQAPSGNGRPAGRIRADDLPAPARPDLAPGPQCFVCGPTPFVEHVSDVLVAKGHLPGHIRTERFG